MPATFDIRASWQGRLVNAFTIGTSTLGGIDTLSGSYSLIFDGAYENLGEGGQGLARSVSWSRGRNDLLTGIFAGDAEIVLNDPTGIYNPQNPASPLAGQLVPLRPAYIKCSDGSTDYGCFRGYIRDYIHEPQPGGHATTTLKLVDLFVLLEQAMPVIAATGATTTGAAIGLVLDEVGFTMPGFRALDTGEAIPDFSADGSASALQLIADLLQAERGVFFIDGSGVATYLNRYDRDTRTIDHTFDGTMRALAGGSALDSIKNRARVTRTGGVEQEASDATSVGLYGYRDFGSITTPYLNTDAEALYLARVIVDQLKDPRSPMWRFELVNATDALLTQILAREVGDRVAIATGGAGASGTEGEFILEQVRVQSEQAGKFLRASWVLSEHSGGNAFTIGTSTLDGIDVLVL